MGQNYRYVIFYHWATCNGSGIGRAILDYEKPFDKDNVSSSLNDTENYIAEKISKENPEHKNTQVKVVVFNYKLIK